MTDHCVYLTTLRSFSEHLFYREPYFKYKSTFSHMLSEFYLHFLRMHHDCFFQRRFKVCECNFFQWKVVLLVIYLFNHDSSKSTTFMLNMAFDILLSAVFVKYSKLEFFVSCNIKLFALCFHVFIIRS